MKTFPIQGPFVQQASDALGKVPLFSSLNEGQLGKVVTSASLHQYDVGEPIVRQGEASDSFFVIMNGAAAVLVSTKPGADPTEVATLGRLDGIGEMGLILDEKRTASVVAKAKLFALRFSEAAFRGMFDNIPGFGLGVCRALAQRLQETSKKLPTAGQDIKPPDAETLRLLPMEFLQRHRLLPLKVEGNTLTLGFVDEPTSQAMSGVRQMLPSFELKQVGIPATLFNDTLATSTGVEGWSSKGKEKKQGTPGPGAPKASSPRLDAILRRLVAEGASDLHLTAGYKPRWRVDGDIRELADTAPLAEEEVFELMEPILRPGDAEHFREANDLDCAYAIEGLSRFRVNVFRDRLGVGAVLRVIPDQILTAEQLGLPPVVIRLSEIPKGLVVVTGPTGSGKSTTLAAMLDSINKTRAEHVITMEDPIEFVHKSRQALFNQREIGAHTCSFGSALKAALRQDPDIVLIGEMRDQETIEMALETANTGHLVFGTLHTATAISTIDRIINVFSPEQQEQVRASLADALKGVIAQCLCKRVGGGRIAALEVLVGNFAVGNLIRAGKTHQIASVMATGLRQGNTMLNAELTRLIREGKVTYEEALSKAVDKPDLAKRNGKEYNPDAT